MWKKILSKGEPWLKPVLLPAPCWWLLLILPRLRADHPHLPPCSGQPSSRAQPSVPQAAAVMNGELERRGRLGKHHLLKKKKKIARTCFGVLKNTRLHMLPCHHVIIPPHHTIACPVFLLSCFTLNHTASSLERRCWSAVNII